jgi:steroid delta-isomerase
LTYLNQLNIFVSAIKEHVMSTTIENACKTLETYIRAWATKDKDLLLSILADSAVMEDPAGTPPFRGREGIGRFWDFALQDSSRTLTPRLEEIRVCGREGILRFTMEVRQPSTKLGLDLSIIEHVEFDEAGRILRLHAFWDERSATVPEGWSLLVPDIKDAYGE